MATVLIMQNCLGFFAAAETIISQESAIQESNVKEQVTVITDDLKEPEFSDDSNIIWEDEFLSPDSQTGPGAGREGTEPGTGSENPLDDVSQDDNLTEMDDSVILGPDSDILMEEDSQAIRILIPAGTALYSLTDDEMLISAETDEPAILEAEEDHARPDWYVLSILAPDEASENSGASVVVYYVRKDAVRTGTEEEIQAQLADMLLSDEEQQLQDVPEEADEPEIQDDPEEIPDDFSHTQDDHSQIPGDPGNTTPSEENVPQLQEDPEEIQDDTADVPDNEQISEQPGFMSENKDDQPEAQNTVPGTDDAAQQENPENTEPANNNTEILPVRSGEEHEPVPSQDNDTEETTEVVSDDHPDKPNTAPSADIPEGNDVQDTIIIAPDNSLIEDSETLQDDHLPGEISQYNTDRDQNSVPGESSDDTEIDPLDEQMVPVPVTDINLSGEEDEENPGSVVSEPAAATATDIQTDHETTDEPLPVNRATDTDLPADPTDNTAKCGSFMVVLESSNNPYASAAIHISLEFPEGTFRAPVHCESASGENGTIGYIEPDENGKAVYYATLLNGDALTVAEVPAGTRYTVSMDPVDATAALSVKALHQEHEPIGVILTQDKAADTQEQLSTETETVEAGESVQITFELAYPSWPVTMNIRNEASEEVTEARLQVLTQDGRLVDEWTSDGAYTLFLNAGSYVLHEEEAPEGHPSAEDACFIVYGDGTVKVKDEEGNFKDLEQRDIELKEIESSQTVRLMGGPRRSPAQYYDSAVTLRKLNEVWTSQVKPLMADAVSFRHADIQDTDEIPEDPIVLYGDPLRYVYCWKDGDTVYWWGNVRTVYLPEDCADMFKQTGLVNIDLTGLDASKTTNMSGMFRECSNLVEVNMSTINAESVQNTKYMFYHCSKLNPTGGLNLSALDGQNLSEANYMFDGCTSLTSVDLSGWGKTKLTSGGVSDMFNQCKSLKTIYVNPNWTTPTVTYPNLENVAVFGGDTRLVGGKGTRYVYPRDRATYMKIDNGSIGYFTAKKALSGYGGFQIKYLQDKTCDPATPAEFEIEITDAYPNDTFPIAYYPAKSTLSADNPNEWRASNYGGNTVRVSLYKGDRICFNELPKSTLYTIRKVGGPYGTELETAQVGNIKDSGSDKWVIEPSNTTSPFAWNDMWLTQATVQKNEYTLFTFRDIKPKYMIPFASYGENHEYLEYDGLEIEITDEKGNYVTNNYFSGTWEAELDAGKYMAREIQPPWGYTQADPVYFEVGEQGEITIYDDNTWSGTSSTSKEISLTHEKAYSVALTMYDENRNEMKGEGGFIIYNEQGKRMASGTVYGMADTQLPVGRYVLHETTVPEGYNPGEPVYFEVTDSGEIALYDNDTWEGEPSEYNKEVPLIYYEATSESSIPVSFAIQDKEGNSLSGAYLEIYKDNGETVDSWTSGEPTHTVLLPQGKYYYHEVMPPDGMMTAQDIFFSVLSNGSVYTTSDYWYETIQKVDSVVMENVPFSAPVVVHVAGSDGKNIAGAQFSLYDGNGTLVESQVSDSNGNVIFPDVSAGNYTIRQDTTSEKYEISTKAIPVEVNEKMPIPDVSSPEIRDAIQVINCGKIISPTGVSLKYMPFLLMLAAACCMMISVCAKRKRV